MSASILQIKGAIWNASTVLYQDVALYYVVRSLYDVHDLTPAILLNDIILSSFAMVSC